MERSSPELEITVTPHPLISCGGLLFILVHLLTSHLYPHEHLVRRALALLTLFMNCLFQVGTGVLHIWVSSCALHCTASGVCRGFYSVLLFFSVCWKLSLVVAVLLLHKSVQLTSLPLHFYHPSLSATLFSLLSFPCSVSLSLPPSRPFCYYYSAEISFVPEPLAYACIYNYRYLANGC